MFQCIRCFNILDVLSGTPRPEGRGLLTRIKTYIQENFPNLLYDLYVTEFKTQGGHAEPMRKFGVSKYIMGRSIYEAKNIGQAIRNAYEEINRE